MSKKIIFTNIYGTDYLFPPEPAEKNIPEWYKSMDSYINGIKRPGGDAQTTATIKKCIPVFDAITSGYIIKSPADVFVSQSQQNGLSGTWWEWAGNDLISFHTKEQVAQYPKIKEKIKDSLIEGVAQPNVPKWTNPWSIKTPKGYSCLFVSPFHRDLPFTIMPGIVDTDTYTNPVNFPFTLNDPNFEGLIPAGTPIVQVIPFKRDSFLMEFGSKKNLDEQFKISKILRSVFFDSYKKQFWNRKFYK